MLKGSAKLRFGIEPEKYIPEKSVTGGPLSINPKRASELRVFGAKEESWLVKEENPRAKTLKGVVGKAGEEKI